jgi:YidC/Oxa1 family membrane protein insertase
MIGFDIRSQGLNKVLEYTAKPLDLEWNLKANRNEKSISYENKYTEIYFEHKDGKVDYATWSLRMSYLKTNIYSISNSIFLYYISFQTPFENASNINELDE